MNPPCFSFWAGAPRRRGPCRGDASGGQLSFAEKKAGKESRQRKPIPRRFPLESFPDGQGRNRAAVSPIGSSFPGKGGGTGVLRGTTGQGSICGDSAACGIGRIPAPVRRRAPRKANERYPQYSQWRRCAYSTRFVPAAPLPPSLQRPPHRGAGAEPRRALSPVSLA